MPGRPIVFAPKEGEAEGTELSRLACNLYKRRARKPVQTTELPSRTWVLGGREGARERNAMRLPQSAPTRELPPPSPSPPPARRSFLHIRSKNRIKAMIPRTKHKEPFRRRNTDGPFLMTSGLGRVKNGFRHKDRNTRRVDDRFVMTSALGRKKQSFIGSRIKPIIISSGRAKPKESIFGRKDRNTGTRIGSPIIINDAHSRRPNHRKDPIIINDRNGRRPHHRKDPIRPSAGKRVETFHILDDSDSDVEMVDPLTNANNRGFYSRESSRTLSAESLLSLVEVDAPRR